MRYFWLAFLGCCLIALAGCDSGSIQSAEGPVPTPNPIFQPEEGADILARPVEATGRPTADAIFEGVFTPAPTSTATPIPTATSNRPTSTPTPSVTPIRLYTETVFSDSLAEGWTLQQSQWMTFSVVAEPTRSGAASLSFAPEEDFGTLFFTVEEDGPVYPRSKVGGVVFWLYSGEQGLQSDDLAVTVIGSNEYPYWVEGDDSVDSPLDGVFSETRLYFLDIEGGVPPLTWVRVGVWLNDLRYDPVYEYVTGFYIKNDRSVFEEFNLDDVALIMSE